MIPFGQFYRRVAGGSVVKIEVLCFNPQYGTHPGHTQFLLQAGALRSSGWMLKSLGFEVHLRLEL